MPPFLVNTHLKPQRMPKDRLPLIRSFPFDGRV